MTLDELKIKVNEVNNKINVEYLEKPGVVFCKKFLEKNKCNSIEQFLEIDLYEACKCLYYILNNGNKTIEESCDFIDSISQHFKSLDSYEFSMTSEMLSYLSCYDNYDLILEYLQENNPIKACKILNSLHYIDENGDLSNKELATKNKDFHNLLIQFRRFKSYFNIVDLLIDVKYNPEIISYIMSLIYTHKEMSEDKEGYLRTLEKNLLIKADSSAAKKMLKDYFKKHYKTKNIISLVDKINAFVVKEDFEKNNHDRLVAREIQSNNQAFDMLLKESKNDEIKDARTIVKRIKDEKLKNMFLQYIYEHNMKYYKVLDKNLEKTRENSITKYLEELNKYRIILDANEVQELMKNDIADFKKIISIINKYSLREKDIITILRTTNLEIVNKIDNYVRDGILNINFVRETPQLFDPSTGILDVIDNNVNLLVANSINPKLFINSLEILLYGLDDQLAINIKILDDYNLKGSLKTTDNYLFLLNSKLVEKIDRLIELGYGDYLKEDLNILNSRNLKRLEILKAINIPVNSIESLRDIITCDRFIINDEDLDEFIPDVLSYKDKIKLKCSLNDLEKYRVDDWSYSINGIIISSNKVKRLLEEGYDIYDALFYNTLLSEDEYSQITENIKQYRYEM